MIAPAALAAPAAKPPLLPGEFSAPALGCTASTILLLWDRMPEKSMAPAAYQVVQDGAVVATTVRLSHTVTGLAPDRHYRFAIRAVDSAGKILAETKSIEATTKPAGRVFDVRDFGAKGDGSTVDTAALQRAIAACTPGGTVYFSPGTYRVGRIVLKSDLTIELTAGAVLRFLGRDEFDYTVSELTVPGSDGELTITSCGMLFAHRADNITLTGAGTIHGNGPAWWPVIPGSRRPRLFELVQCRNVLVQGITLEDPPSWNTHPRYVEGAVFSGVTFVKRTTAPGGRNGDGLDPESCRDVLIVGCTFGNQDDSIAIKSGRANAEQPRRQRPSENIVIRDCRFDGTLAPGSRPLGIAIGSEISGGVRNVTIRDCEFVNSASVLFVKTNRDNRGVVVENVRVENCSYVNRSNVRGVGNRAPLSFEMFYYRPDDDPSAAVELTPATPTFRNIQIRGVTIVNPGARAIYLRGLPERPVQQVVLEDVEAECATGLFAQNIDGITLANVRVRAASGPPFEWVNVTRRETSAAGGR